MSNVARRPENHEHESGEKNLRVRVFCVTHTAPLVPEALADFEIGLGDYHPPSARGVHISALDPFWDKMRPYSYGAAGNYVIPKALHAIGSAKFTGVFSHRKIITRSQIGKRSPASDFYYDVEMDDAARLPREEIEPRPGFDFLVGFPMKCKQSIVAQYIDDHYGIDLFNYVSVAVDMGILPLYETQSFASEQLFIPGGCESGVYPTSWLQPILENLERLGREFVTRRASRIRTYDNYQIRAVGFLAERLGSYLLLSELRMRYPSGPPPELFGHLCVIVPPGESYGIAKV